jgi:probable rRNA maturation factor
MRMNIAVASHQSTRKINRSPLRQITGAVLAEWGIETAEIGIHLVTGREMTRLNETFLRHAGSTDVITFDYSPAETVAAPVPARRKTGRNRAVTGPAARLHGEIFICVEEAVSQGHRFGTAWQSEIVRYLIHGILHLLGFNDSPVKARRRMKLEENRLLRKLGRRFSLAQPVRRTKLSA